MNEKWKEIPCFVGYEVSSWGNVRSSRRGKLKNLKPGPCGPYLMVILMQEGKRVPKLIHRLVLEAFVGPCPEGWEARHINGSPKDNSLENLEWATHLANMQDKVAHGTLNRNRAYGQDHKSARLTAFQVEAIRVEYSSGTVTQQQLADKYRTSRANIGLIVNRKNWKRVD